MPQATASQAAVLSGAAAALVDLLNAPGAGVLLGVAVVLGWLAWVQPHICANCKRPNQ